MKGKKKKISKQEGRDIGIKGAEEGRIKIGRETSVHSLRLVLWNKGRKGRGKRRATVGTDSLRTREDAHTLGRRQLMDLVAGAGQTHSQALVKSTAAKHESPHSPVRLKLYQTTPQHHPYENCVEPPSCDASRREKRNSSRKIKKRNRNLNLCVLKTIFY